MLTKDTDSSGGSFSALRLVVLLGRVSVKKLPPERPQQSLMMATVRHPSGVVAKDGRDSVVQVTMEYSFSLAHT